jgi:hypothetical protein
MRPVEFGEALAPRIRLTLFSADKPDRFFNVMEVWMDETSGIALALRTGVPSYQVEDEEGRFIYCFTYQSRKRMKTDGAFGGRIRKDLIQGLFLMVRWWRITGDSILLRFLHSDLASY